MEYASDVELILNSLNKECKELSDKLNGIDKLIRTHLTQRKSNKLAL